MSLSVGAAAARPTPLVRANPLAKLAAAVPVVVTLPFVTRLVPALGVLAVEAVLLPLVGLAPLAVWRRAWPLLLSATAIGVSTVVAAPSHSVLLATTAALRVVGFVLPGLLLLATTDPTDLADALAQRLHLPVRPVLATLAALRLVSVLGDEWRTIGTARRARGIDAGGSPVAAVRLLAGQSFTLLVGAIRRGTRLAAAMETRGLGGSVERTWARPSVWRGGDWLVLAGGLALGVLPVALTLWTRG